MSTFIPKLLLLDRDSLLNFSSSSEGPFYYVLHTDSLIIKPGVREAMKLIGIAQKSWGMKVVLATRQRCIAKGLVTLKEVKALNAKLENDLDFSFDDVYIEPEEKSKEKILREALSDFGVKPQDALLIDDSDAQCQIASDLGINVILSNNLLGSICSIFKIT